MVDHTFHLVKNASSTTVIRSRQKQSAGHSKDSNDRKGPSWMLKDFLQASNITVVDDHTVKFKQIVRLLPSPRFYLGGT